MDLSFERAIEFARDLIRIPSPPGGEGEVAARLRAELEALQFDEVWSDDVGNVFGRIRGTGEAPAVILCSHMDVVDAGDPSTWEHHPYAADIDDVYLHGRGAMDIKGPLAIQTVAAAHFIQNRLPNDVLIAHTVFEERGGWGMAHLLAEGVRGGAVILGEATNDDINIGHRGRAELHVEIHGAAAHASAPERARSPLDLLGDVLGAIRDFAAALPSNNDLGRSTAVATAVETFPGSRNVIPETARITIDWRVLPEIGADSGVRMLNDFIQKRVTVPEGYTVEVRFATTTFTAYTGRTEERKMFTPGYWIEREHAVVTAAIDAVAATTGRRPGTKPWTFATDGGHACGVYGIPCIGYAPGEERYAHTNRERLELAQARRAYDAYPSLIKAVAEAVNRAE